MNKVKVENLDFALDTVTFKLSVELVALRSADTTGWRCEASPLLLWHAVVKEEENAYHYIGEIMPVTPEFRICVAMLQSERRSHGQRLRT